ncbi:MAG: gamma-glutamylcyclotransferase family protein [Solirubrobacterales bacterium]
MRTNLYFAYGSNLSRAGMASRCPGAKPLCRASLGGWRLTFRGVADIEPAPRRSVLGALWLLGPQDLFRLDRYEGAPSLYERREVEVATEKGPRLALAYVMTGDEYLGLPSPHYLRAISRGFRDWGLPPEVLARAVEETAARLERLGPSGYRADGAKRLRAVFPPEEE